jgi:hypothetical protein
MAAPTHQMKVKELLNLRICLMEIVPEITWSLEASNE